MEIFSFKTRLFLEGEDILTFLVDNVKNLEEGDILVITSKICSLHQYRVAKLSQKEKIIKNESLYVLKTPWAFLTKLKKYGWCINAGIDESNANKNIILLPNDPDNLAKFLCVFLKKKFRLKKLGVVITDTKSLPLRQGTIGRAVGLFGFLPLKNYIGKKDLFGRKTRYTKSNIVDAIASSAVLLMGEGDESVPIVLIKNAPVFFTNKKVSSDLSIDPKNDIFRFVYAFSLLNQK